MRLRKISSSKARHFLQVNLFAPTKSTSNESITSQTYLTQNTYAKSGALNRNLYAISYFQ